MNYLKYYVLLGVLCATCVSAYAQGRIQPRPYVRGDVGFGLTEDMDAEFFPGAGDVTLELDPGFRFGVAGGAMFGDFVGLELETGFIVNEVDSITGFNDVDAWVSQVPFLVNIVFQYRNNTGLTPYAGVGAGGSIVGIDIEDADSLFVELDGYDSDMVFAAQVFAGLRYEIDDHFSVGLIYRYLWSDDGEWDVEDTSQDIEFEGANSHSISAMVNFRF